MATRVLFANERKRAAKARNIAVACAEATIETNEAARNGVPIYIGIVTSEKGRAHGVWFPDMPGAHGAADDLADIFDEAVRTLRHHAEALESAGKPVPAPRDPAEVMTAHAADLAELALAGGGGMFVLTPLYLDAGRSVRLNISLDAGLVEAIDTEATVRGLTRSGFIAQAAREKIRIG